MEIEGGAEEVKKEVGLEIGVREEMGPKMEMEMEVGMGMRMEEEA